MADFAAEHYAAIASVVTFVAMVVYSVFGAKRGENYVGVDWIVMYALCAILSGAFWPPTVVIWFLLVAGKLSVRVFSALSWPKGFPRSDCCMKYGTGVGITDSGCVQMACSMCGKSWTIEPKQANAEWLSSQYMTCIDSLKYDIAMLRKEKKEE